MLHGMWPSKLHLLASAILIPSTFAHGDRRRPREQLRRPPTFSLGGMSDGICRPAVAAHKGMQERNLDASSNLKLLRSIYKCHNCLECSGGDSIDN